MPKKSDQLHSLAEADAVLRVLGDAEARAAKLIAAAQAKIDRIKADLAEALAEPNAIRKSTRRVLERFLGSHAGLVKTPERKTVDLQFGTIGFRTPPPSLVWAHDYSEADVIAAIRCHRPDDAPVLIETRERVIKDAVKFILDVDEMAQIGCLIDQEDVYVIEPRTDAAVGAMAPLEVA